MHYALQTLFLKTPCLLLVYKGTKGIHRLLVVLSQKNYDREQSLRTKHLLGCTGTLHEYAYAVSETNSKQKDGE